MERKISLASHSVLQSHSAQAAEAGVPCAREHEAAASASAACPRAWAIRLEPRLGDAVALRRCLPMAERDARGEEALWIVDAPSSHGAA